MFICSCVPHSPWREFRHLEFADSVLLSVSLLITIMFASILRQCVKLLQIEIHHGIYLHSLLWYSCNHSDALRLLYSAVATPSTQHPPELRVRAGGLEEHWIELLRNFAKIFLIKMLCFDANGDLDTKILKTPINGADKHPNFRRTQCNLNACWA